MRTIILMMLLTAIGIGAATAGPCNVPSDRAKDGSRCGDRAASERPGGR